MTAKQHTKDQHTVPKCYLKTFSENGTQIFRKLKTPYVDYRTLEKELAKPTALKKATVVENFYTVNKGNNPMLVETLIYANEIENLYPKIYETLINPSIDKFNMEFRQRLFMCLLSLHCRTPKQFNLYAAALEKIIPNAKINRKKIIEDYKVLHVKDVLPKFIEAHQFKMIRIVKIKDNSEFITSDNPLLIIGKDKLLKNTAFQEQFNSENKILIPLDRKHYCIITNVMDKNGLDFKNRAFYNKIERIEVDASFTLQANLFQIDSAEKYFFGSKKYMKVFFNFVRLK